jgi:photosystem II stability/assembly factor-like uncharacterized protein
VITDTADGGATPWHFLAPSGTTGYLYGVSCPSSTTCFAVDSPNTGDGEIIKTTNGGQFWGPSLAVNQITFNTINCPTTSVCFAIGLGVIYATKDAGVTWAAQIVGSSQRYVDISCPNATTCIVVTQLGSFIKTTDGINWSAPAGLGTASGLNGISCPNTSTCFATDNSTPGQVFSTNDGGTTWTLSFNLATDPQAGGTSPLGSISCPSVTVCYAAGGPGLVATTTNAGATWRTDFTSSNATVTGISCPSISSCYASATDSTILYTTDYGGTWTVQLGSFNTYYRSLSCPTTTACFAVGANGVISATTIAGSAWTKPAPSEPTTLVKGMSCATASDCYAVAFNYILVTHDGGTTWTSQLVPGTDQLLAVSCPAANTCFAVGWPGTIYSTGNGGSTWTRQANSLYGSDNTFVGVSCASTTMCVAVGTQGTIMSTTNGSTWAAETSGTAHLLAGVSCPNTFSCMAVGGGGVTMTRSGGSWQVYPSGTPQTLHGVSCPVQSTCYAVGDAGTVLVTSNRGGNWTAQASGTVHDLHGVGCAQTLECLAVGNYATAVITVNGSTWSGVSMPTGNALRSVVFQDPAHAWLGGAGGTILANATLTPYVCASAAASSAPGSPQVVGTTVTITATSTGCPNPRYQFWIMPPGGSWTIAQPYSSSATFNWNTTGLPAGTYSYSVWVRDASGAATYDAFVPGTAYTLTATPPCTSAAASAAPSSPQPAGTTIAITATSTGCANPRYEFWIKPPGGSWTVAQGYSASATFSWNTTGLPGGTYSYSVWARDNTSGAGYDAYFPGTAYTLTTTACTSVAASAAPASPQASATTITISATSTGCANPRYEFWILPPSGSWTIAQSYSSTASFSWDTTGKVAGSYRYSVWVRDATSAASYDAYFPGTAFTLTSTACTSASASAAPASPQPHGTAITVTATSSGCAHPLYEFWIKAPGGSWTVVQAYSTTATFSWNTTGLPPGTYSYSVWVRDSGSAAGYEKYFPGTAYTLS